MHLKKIIFKLCKLELYWLTVDPCLLHWFWKPWIILYSEVRQVLITHFLSLLPELQCAYQLRRTSEIQNVYFQKFIGITSWHQILFPNLLWFSQPFCHRKSSPSQDAKHSQEANFLTLDSSLVALRSQSKGFLLLASLNCVCAIRICADGQEFIQWLLPIDFSRQTWRSNVFFVDFFKAIWCIMRSWFRPIIRSKDLRIFRSSIVALIPGLTQGQKSPDSNWS